jgi:hypothetical protein
MSPRISRRDVAGLRQMNVSVSEDALDRVVNWLMTEFWDQSFSQTEIRKAFTAALADPNRYAAGEERRWPHPAFDALIGTVPNRPAFHRPLESLHLRVETTIEAIDEKGLVRIADRVVPGGGRLAARRSCG